MTTDDVFRKATKTSTSQRADGLADSLVYSGRGDLIAECLRKEVLTGELLRTLGKMESSAAKDKLVLALMLEKFPDDYETGQMPVGSHGPAALQYIFIRTISSRLPNEHLHLDDASVQRLFSRSERLKLAEEFRDILELKKAGSQQLANASQPLKERASDSSPRMPAQITTPVGSPPVVPTIVANSTSVVEHRSPVWLWIIGIGALLVVAALTLKRRT